MRFILAGFFFLSCFCDASCLCFEAARLAEQRPLVSLVTGGISSAVLGARMGMHLYIGICAWLFEILYLYAHAHGSVYVHVRPGASVAIIRACSFSLGAASGCPAVPSRFFGGA